MDLSLLDKVLHQNTNLHMVYAGPLSQELISEMTQTLEKEAEEAKLSMTDATNLFTVFIELSQNIVNYTHKQAGTYRHDGLLLVSQSNDKLDFFIQSQNLIKLEDQVRLEPKLKEIKAMDKDTIKQRYRELRKSGHSAHDKGAGIGFYEIAKRCDDIDYEFVPTSDGQYNFRFRAHLAVKKPLKA